MPRAGSDHPWPGPEIAKRDESGIRWMETGRPLDANVMSDAWRISIVVSSSFLLRKLAAPQRKSDQKQDFAFLVKTLGCFLFCLDEAETRGRVELNSLFGEKFENF